MRVHYKFGLLLIFLLFLSKYCTHAAPTNQNLSTIADDEFDYDDYNDEDDYYNDSKEMEVGTKETKAEKMLPDTAATPSLPKETIAINANDYEYDKSSQEIIDIPPKRSNHVLEPICPKRCICLKDYKYINCSQSELTQIPHDIPPIVTHLDLSQNHLSNLSTNDLLNYTKLREINLSGNHLTEISKEIFAKKPNLKKINLSNNLLQVIPPDTFTGVPDLEALDLSDNQIALPAKAPFLNQPRLLELTCRNCTWNSLYDETFENLSSLTALRLDKNDFNKKINTKAFEPLRNLIKLNLPPLDQQSVTELCKLLKAIDNIAFKHFDVSCYELVLGYSYNESLIQTSESPLHEITKLEQAANSNSNSNSATSTKMSAPNDGSALLNATNDEADANNLNSSLASAGIFTHTATTPATPDDGKSYQVPVSPEAINIMLICIMIIAVIGLAVGLACRKDVGGIKTKCCRTTKTPPKDEETQPAEEIPLNKMN